MPAFPSCAIKVLSIQWFVIGALISVFYLGFLLISITLKKRNNRDIGTEKVMMAISVPLLVLWWAISLYYTFHAIWNVCK